MILSTLLVKETILWYRFCSFKVEHSLLLYQLNGKSKLQLLAKEHPNIKRKTLQTTADRKGRVTH